ncbi:MAG TPA: Fic family protein [Pseudobdellovibrionaceae bacterium]|jgi:prophage maintenance system killer protein
MDRSLFKQDPILNGFIFQQKMLRFLFTVYLLISGSAAQAQITCAQIFSNSGPNQPQIVSLSGRAPDIHIGYYLEPHPLQRVQIRNASLKDLLQIGGWLTLPGEPAYLEITDISKNLQSFTARDPLHLRFFTVLEQNGFIEILEISNPHPPTFKKGTGVENLERKFTWRTRSVSDLTADLFQQQKDVTDLLEERSYEEKENLKAAISYGVDKLKKNKGMTEQDLETLNQTLRLGKDSEHKQFTWPSDVLGVGLIRGFAPRLQSFHLEYQRNQRGGWDQTQGEPSNFLVDLSQTEMTNGSPPLYYLPAKQVPPAIKNWLKEFNKINENTDFFKIAELYQKFVIIHPFSDGNGRTSRILLDLMLMKAGFRGLKHSETDSRSTIYRTQEEIAEMLATNIIPS